jgi:hypothetical protein
MSHIFSATSCGGAGPTQFHYPGDSKELHVSADFLLGLSEAMEREDPESAAVA